MLRKVGSFNDIPQDMMPPKLKPKEVVLFQLLNGKPSHVRPDDTVTDVPPIIYNISQRIPTRDRIKTTDGRIVEIGVVETVNEKDQVTKTKLFFFPAMTNQGLFSIQEGVLSQEEFYEFFMLSNLNSSNKFRDDSIEPLFKTVDPMEDANLSIARGSDIADAAILVKNMKLPEMRKLAAALNWNSQAEPQILQGDLMAMAVSNPRKLLDLVEDPDAGYKAVVKMAVENGIIYFKEDEYKYVWTNGGQTVAKLDRSETGDELDAMADWLKSHTNGAAVHKKLSGMVTAKTKKEKTSDEA